MTSFSIQNFGCRVNQAEAFLWANDFQKHGLKLERDFRSSDIVLVNTCTLTSRADRDVRKFVRKVARLNPEAKLIVTGCSVERMYEEFRTIPQVWRIFPNNEKKDLASKVLSIIDAQDQVLLKPFRSRALLKIQDGCNFGCTFCIIPQVRGKSISFEKEEILAQVKKFISQGFRELVLTGIHLSSYGHDLKPRSSLLELLQEIEKLEGLGRIRLSSLDPRFLSPALIDYLTISKKICPHFHLSLQHGSDRVLELMGRKIKVKDFEGILSRLRENSPDASLGADIIVGFPGEQEEDFQATFDFLERSPLTYFHVFSYSARPGTLASNWPQVEEKIKKKRAAILRNLSAKKNLKFRRLFLGRECEAIVVEKEKDSVKVLTSNYFKVIVPTCSHEEGEELTIKITQVNARETLGEICS